LTAPALLLLALAAPGPCLELLTLTDLHGRVAELPRIAAAIRPVRAGGPSLLLDAGDSLQGTLEASLSLGEAVVAGYGALGVDASVVGNHDLDYGQEVLRRRLEGAPYPFLAANLREKATGRLPAWRNLHGSHVFRPPGGPVVGVFGLASPETPRETMPSNAAGLTFGPLAREARRQALALRGRGAELVVGVVHGGGSCRSFADASDLSSCDPRSTLFRLAEALPPGTVDALVGGHSHGLVAHRVNGTALVQAGAKGEAVGWVTLCEGAAPAFHAFLRAGEAEDPRVKAAVAPFLAAALAERQRSTGVRLATPLTRSRSRVSTLGAAAAQGARLALGAEVGVVNAGGIRADLPAGELRQGALFEALPFDDGVARLPLTGDELTALLRTLSGGRQGTPQVAGLRLEGDRPVTCDGAALDPGRTYLVAMNEFLAAGGDGTRPILSRLPPGSVEVKREVRLRDALVRWLREAPPGRAGQPCP
jgi:5'-nucleotidase